MKNKSTIAIILLIVGILGAVIATVLLVRSKQDVRSRADTFDTFTPPALPSPTIVADGTLNQAGDTCPAPATVTNVVADYPNLVDGVADFAKASCAWDSSEEAVSYAVKITEVDTGSILKNEAVNSSETSYVFDVANGKTYRCEVAAINDCGAQGVAGSDEVLCETDVVPEASPTVAPTVPVPTSSVAATLAPTSPPVATGAPIPTLPPTGAVENLAIAALGGVVLMILGGLLFLF